MMGKKLNLKFFEVLPSEIIIHILSRLPVRSIVICKCVCKSWLQLVKTSQFARSHLSKADPETYMHFYCINSPTSRGVIEFTDDEYHKLDLMSALTIGQSPYFPNFTHPFGLKIEGSSDGLLLCNDFHSLFICNPITQEYIDLDPQKDLCREHSYGFGKSNITGKYKVVALSRILKSEVPTKSILNVYTIGTGSWRSIASDVLADYKSSSNATFLNGNLHWLTSKGSLRISCFNLETELFTTFFLPQIMSTSTTRYILLTLENCLCLCFYTERDEVVIWLMNEYGFEESWTKKFLIRTPRKGVILFPLKVFKDGNILLSHHYCHTELYYYSSKNKTIRKVERPGVLGWSNPALHTSSFLSLKSFVMENSISY